MKKNKGNLSFLLRYAWRFNRKLYLYFILNILFLLINSIAIIMAPRYLMNELMNGKSAETIIIIAAVFFIVTAIFGSLSAMLKGLYVPSLKFLRAECLRDLQKRVMTMDYANIENPDHLDKMHLAHDAVTNFSTGVEGVLTKFYEISSGIATSLFFISILSLLNFWIIALISVNVIISFYLMLRAYKYELSNNEKKTPLYRKTWYLNGIMSDHEYGKDIRIYGISNWLLDRFKQVYRNLRGITVTEERKYRVASYADLMFSILRDGLVYGFLIYGVINGNIAVSDFMMYLTAVAALTIALQEIFDGLAFVIAQQKRITEYRDYMNNTMTETSENKAKAPYGKINKIEFRDVSFKYPSSDTYVLEKFNLTINQNEKLAIIGINGAGKTTLVKLLTRLYKPSSGSIFLNGIDIQDYDLKEYRSLFSTVFQEINLFPLTLGENIAMTDNSKINRERVQISIEKAGFGDKLKTLENGLDTNMLKRLQTDGIELSGGEKQKLAIARALYRDGDIIIMDEPTAALDAIAECRLYTELSDISAGKTVIFISHRLASTRFCDKIAMISDKAIAELGTHDELIAKSGIYYDMFMTQMSYYQDDLKEGDCNA